MFTMLLSLLQFGILLAKKPLQDHVEKAGVAFLEAPKAGKHHAMFAGPWPGCANPRFEQGHWRWIHQPWLSILHRNTRFATKLHLGVGGATNAASPMHVPTVF